MADRSGRRSRGRQRQAAIVLLLIAVIGTVLFLRRGGDQEDAVPPSSSDNTEAEAEAEPIEDVSPCPSPEAFCIALVTSTSVADDQLSAVGWAAVEQLSDDNDAAIGLVESPVPVDQVPDLQALVNEGFDLIVTVGFDLAGPTRTSALANPNTDFVALGQPPGDVIPNLAVVSFPVSDAGLLAGKLAAMVSETGVIAAVLGTDLLPATVVLADGFEQGALSVNPDIEVLTRFHPGTLDEAADDPEWGADTTAELLANGADVVLEAGGTTGAGVLARAAGSEGVFCLGLSADRWELVESARPCLLSSAADRVDLALADLIASHLDGTFPGGEYGGKVELTPYREFTEQVPEAATALLATDS